MNRKILSVLAGFLLAGAASARADETEPARGVGLSAKVGTLGFGLDATVGANDYLGFRCGINWMALELKVLADEGTINTDMDWLSYGLLMDVYPFGGGFRITGGALINQNAFKMDADLDEPVELAGQDFWLDDLTGEVTFRDFAPYVGIGVGNAVGSDGRWHFVLDVGILFQGEPEVSAQATASDPAWQGLVDEALDEEVADIEEDAKVFQWYPVISLGLSFKF